MVSSTPSNYLKRFPAVFCRFGIKDPGAFIEARRSGFDLEKEERLSERAARHSLPLPSSPRGGLYQTETPPLQAAFLFVYELPNGAK